MSFFERDRTKVAARTGALARRLLFPSLAYEEPLPPLVVLEGGDDGTDELNGELYDTIALSLRAFVLPWWSKISRFDRDLTPRIAQIVVHVVHSLQVRLARPDTDILALLLHDVPQILTVHYTDYRLAKSKLSSVHVDNTSSSLAHVFHTLQPHVAITPDGTVDPTYLRLLVEHIMKQCLPPEDWGADTERFVVREVIVHILIQNMFERIVQPWFWMKLTLDLRQTSHTKRNSKRFITPRRRQCDFCGILILLLSLLQSFSGFALSLIDFGRWIYHLGFKEFQTSNADTSLKRSSLLRPTLVLASEVLTLRDRNASNAIFSCLISVDAIFRTLINWSIYRCAEMLFSPNKLSGLAKVVNNIMFPNDGYPAPRPNDPSPAEQARINMHLEEYLNDIASSSILWPLLGHTAHIRRKTIQDLAEPLTNAACNAHLFLFLLDATVLHLFPELAVLDLRPSDGNEE